MPPKAFLRVRGGPEDGNTIALSQDKTTVMGRTDDNDAVADEPRVSRQHVAIRVGGEGYWIEDLSSRNCTFLNGQRIEGEGKRLND